MDDISRCRTVQIEIVFDYDVSGFTGSRQVLLDLIEHEGNRRSLNGIGIGSDLRAPSQRIIEVSDLQDRFATLTKEGRKLTPIDLSDVATIAAFRAGGGKCDGYFVIHEASPDCEKADLAI